MPTGRRRRVLARHRVITRVQEVLGDEADRPGDGPHLVVVQFGEGPPQAPEVRHAGSGVLLAERHLEVADLLRHRWRQRAEQPVDQHGVPDVRGGDPVTQPTVRRGELEDRSRVEHRRQVVGPGVVLTPLRRGTHDRPARAHVRRPMDPVCQKHMCFSWDDADPEPCDRPLLRCPAPRLPLMQQGRAAPGGRPDACVSCRTSSSTARGT